LTAAILRDLNIRKFSYPFDWCSSNSQLYDTNLDIIVDIIKRRLKGGENDRDLMVEMIGSNLENGELNKENNLIFPGDKNQALNEVYDKYIRRFERMIEHITSREKCLYIFVNRYADISDTKIKELSDMLLEYNSESKLILFLGKEHKHFNDISKSIIYKYIPYDPTQFYEYDYSHFRPAMTEYFKSIC